MRKPKNITVSTISSPEEKFCGWPTVARRKNGELLVAFSGGREAHVCPFGRLSLLRSKDGGGGWDGPEILADGPLDDRDAGVIETGNGTIIVSWFTSTAWISEYKNKYKDADESIKRRYDLWRGRAESLDGDTILKELGHWCIRSEDGGRTWSGKIPTIANSPHGPVKLADGRLLYAGHKTAKASGEGDLLRERARGPQAGAAESIDDGRSWRWIGTIEPAEGHDPSGYSELHAVECPDGKIIAHIRNRNERNKYEILQTESMDGGTTWGRPFSTGIWGYPSHLLRLGDGRILTTYGHRREPFGVQARISRDNGGSWGESLVLLGEGPPRDLGYPSTVQLDGGRLATVWYECPQPGVYNENNDIVDSFKSCAELRMAVWDAPD